MSETIPGGRQRAASEGDVIDEEDEEGATTNHVLSPPPSRRKVNRSLPFPGVARAPHTGSETQIYYPKGSEGAKKHRKPSFKSVKNFVSRVMRQPIHHHQYPHPRCTGEHNENSAATGGRNDDDDDDDNRLSNNWTGEHMNGNHLAVASAKNYRYSESTSRPLLTSISSCVQKWERTPGTSGLYNHGNTCFMNAVLQCISSADLLAEYFVSGKHKEDLRNNKSNSKKFGTKGEVTEQLGILVRSLWSGKYNADISSNFKVTVGKYNAQYKGTDQHDAQEFLLWLLDKVHEDLNIPPVKKKVKSNPQTTTTFMSEEQMAADLEENNNSYIYQLFRALCRSSLTCLNCQKQSNTFDPYLCLSLPLPQKTLRSVYIVLVYLDTKFKNMKIGLQIKTTDTVKDLRYLLSTYTKIPTSQLVFCQIYDDGFRQTYEDSQPLSDIHESETLYLFEMPAPPSPSQHLSHYQMSLIHILLVHVERINSPSKCIQFCCPQVVSVPRDINYIELQRKILSGMSEFIKEGLLTQNPSKLGVLFKLRVIDGNHGKDGFLPHDVEMPLYMPIVDRALSFCEKVYGPLHLKLVAEWDSNTKDIVVTVDEDVIEEHVSVQKIRQAQQKMSYVNLEDCFQLYTQEEKLSGDVAWRCPYCQKEQQGTVKKLRLWSLPGLLVLHLKRFKQVKMQRNKLNIFVDFPVLGLSLKQHLVSKDDPTSHLLSSRPKNDDVYDLFAVCNHYGNMNGGHYTAFCRNPVDSSWYQFDDARVKPLQESEVVTKAAYLLFYQRRNLTATRAYEIHAGNHWIYQLYRTPALQARLPSPKSMKQVRSMTPPTPRREKPVSPKVSLTPQLPRRSNLSSPTLTKAETFFGPKNFVSTQRSVAPSLPAEPRQQRNGSSLYTKNSAKYATIARTESPGHLDQFGTADQFMPRSRTHASMDTQSQRSYQSSSSKGTDACGNLPRTEYQRYQPQKHLYAHYGARRKTRQREAFLHEKLYAPCLKESSV